MADFQKKRNTGHRHSGGTNIWCECTERKEMGRVLSVQTGQEWRRADSLVASSGSAAGNLEDDDELIECKTIVLAEHQPMMLEALVPYVRRAADKVVVIEARSLDEVMDIVASSREVDLFIVGRGVLGSLGIDTLRNIYDRRPSASLAVLCETLDAVEVEQALDMGVAGYLPKSMPGGAFVSALSLVLNGERFLPSEFSMTALRRARMDWREDAGDDARHAVGLTVRQWAVLREIIQGRSNKEIARQLGIGEITVKVHLQAVFKKLQVANRTQAATYAVKHGWFSDAELKTQSATA